VDILSVLEEIPTYSDHDVPYQVEMGNEFLGYIRINRDIPEEVDPENEDWWHSLDHQEQAPSYIRPLLERNNTPDFIVDIDRVGSAPLLNREAPDHNINLLDESGESYLVTTEQCYPEDSRVIGEAIMRGDIREDWSSELEEIEYSAPEAESPGELVMPDSHPSSSREWWENDPNFPTGPR
jgi:hypothetical protein